MSSSLEEPKTVRAPEAQDAGGPTAAPKPASGGTYSQGAKTGGEAGTIPSGAINAKNLTTPRIAFEIDGE
jgi:formate dehydrogenase major subunit